MCPSSYCKEHREGMLFISKLDGKLSCSEHDPCGPDPLEPGEIREYVPTTTSVRPGSMAVPVTPSLAPDSRRASSSSSAATPVSSPTGQAELDKQEPPPRLYINTKTATSSFIPSNRVYLTDRTEGFSTPTSSKGEREDGEVEDGEVCGLEVEDADDDVDDDEDDEEEEEDDDDDDEEEEEEEAEEEEDEMEEMEIVEDEEEDQPLYGNDLLEEGEEDEEEQDQDQEQEQDDEQDEEEGEDEDEEDDDDDKDDKDDEGGDVYDTWGGYVDEDEDGEVEGEDFEEWGRVEDDDKWHSPSIPF